MTDDPRELTENQKQVISQINEHTDAAVVQINMHTDELVSQINEHTDTVTEDTFNRAMEQVASITSGLATAAQAQEILDLLEQLMPERTWRDEPDLIDASFRPVLGIHTGGDRRASSDPDVIEEAMGRVIQAAPIYRITLDDPYPSCSRLLASGTLPRLELCLPHIITSTGEDMGGDFWSRGAEGQFDGELEYLLGRAGALDASLLLSFSHEADLRSEDGASPKSDSPPPATYCGSYGDYSAFWEHVAGMARTLVPKARLFLNFSGGYADAPDRWDTMLPSLDSFDFFGWDPYNMWGKQQGAEWQSFESRLKMFGRWDWYKRTIPDKPIIIGETGTCSGPGDGGKWLLDMVDFMVENRWQGVGTGGGISQIHYFSHHYSEHPRCLDDAGTHFGCLNGQKYSVLAQIGLDDRLSWAV